MSATEYMLFFLGGFMAGIINTLAGNGSAITLSLLMFAGMSAPVANATNRIGAFIQTATAVLSLRKTKRTRFLFKDSLWFFAPAIAGSLLGAFWAVDTDPGLLKTIMGGVMLIMFITMVFRPAKWLKATDVSKPKKTWVNGIMIFLTAIYGGFIQMGIGVILLSILVLIADYSLRDANIIKLILSFIFVFPAFFVFFYSGDIAWLPGLVLGAGQGLGAMIGARYILFLPAANKVVRYTLIVILFISAVTLLQLPQKVAYLFNN